MKNHLNVFVAACLFVMVLLVSSCGQTSPQTGLLQGSVTIGPITPVEIPGQNPIVPPEVFSSRKVLVYDSAGKSLIKEVIIYQVKQTANGYYTVQLEPGVYQINVTNTGIGGGANLPETITITAGQTMILDIDIDTGIR
jgi:hypothetical protein